MNLQLANKPIREFKDADPQSGFSDFLVRGSSRDAEQCEPNFEPPHGRVPCVHCGASRSRQRFSAKPASRCDSPYHSGASLQRVTVEPQSPSGKAWVRAASTGVASRFPQRICRQTILTTRLSCRSAGKEELGGGASPSKKRHLSANIFAGSKRTCLTLELSRRQANK